MRNRLLIVILLTISTFSIFSEDSKNLKLNQISVEDGLPNASVSSILQDNMGFLWFGTQGGLARYDGYNFEVFDQDPFNENSLSHNLVQTMYLDYDGSIWVGTYDGLNLFDPITNRFTKYNGSGTESETKQ